MVSERGKREEKKCIMYKCRKRKRREKKKKPIGGAAGRAAPGPRRKRLQTASGERGGRRTRLVYGRCFCLPSLFDRRTLGRYHIIIIYK